MHCSIGSSLVAQTVKNLLAKIDSWVGKIPWRRAWQPTPVFLPGESHGQRSLVGCSSWGHTELDITEWLTHQATSWKHTHFFSRKFLISSVFNKFEISCSWYFLRTFKAQCTCTCSLFSIFLILFLPILN